jgi:hypothetical protein
MMGFLKVKDLMDQAGVYKEDLFDDVFAECSAYFESADRLHLDIKDEFTVTYPTNYKGMGVKEKVASGIINVCHKKGLNLGIDMPFEIDMPVMEEV